MKRIHAQRLYIARLLWRRAAKQTKATRNTITWSIVVFVIYYKRCHVESYLTSIYHHHNRLRLKTLHKDQVPAYVGQDNTYIHYGHRRAPSTSLDCIKSICGYHNETFNIWSHTLACAYYLHKLNVHLRNSSSKMYALSIQLLCSSLCFGISAIAHTFNHHSQTVSSLLFSLDRASIALMSCSHSISVGSIHFNSQRGAKRVYILAAVLAAVRTTQRVTSDSADPTTAFKSFVLQLAISAVPIVRETLAAGDIRLPEIQQLLRDSFQCYIWGLLGGITFAYKIPERFRPGAFDFLGNGHQLMHVMGFLSSAIGYAGCKRYHNWKMQ